MAVLVLAGLIEGVRMWRGHPHRWLRSIVIGLIAVPAAVGLSLVALWWLFIYRPGPNAEAKRREQVLLALRPDDLSVDGLRLVYSGSSAGLPAGEPPFESEQEVRAVNRYSFTGELTATCEAIVQRFLDDGWALERYPGCGEVRHPVNDAGVDLMSAGLVFDCGTFSVSGGVSLRIDPAWDPPRDVTISLQTDYPSDRMLATTVPDERPSARCTVAAP